MTDEVNAWLEENWDPDLTVEEWWDRLGRPGWATPTWPTEWYGTGCRAPTECGVMQAISRSAPLGAPGGLGTLLAGPTIAVHGTDEQKQRYLLDIVTGKQALVPALQRARRRVRPRRAQRRGPSATATSGSSTARRCGRPGGHWSDLGMLLARTDPDVPKHQGITYFAVDMHQPGVEVRPLREMTGRGHFNEVFLTDVRVPTTRPSAASTTAGRSPTPR